MKSNKILASGLSALLGITMLAGCSSGAPETGGTNSGGSGSGSAPTPITITVWTPSEDQSADNGNWLDKELTAFKEAHPEWDLTINTGVSPEGDTLKNIQTDPEAAADVFMYANDQIPDMLSINALARLGGATLEQVQKQSSSTTLNTVSYNGGVYGVPFTGNTWFMYYDKRVFSEDDVKNLDTMLEKGKVGFPLSNSWYIASFYVANGCTLFGENGGDADAGFDFGGDKAVAVTNYLVDLAANPNFVDANGLSPSTLADGTINCLFSGTWDYAAVVDAIGEENVGICAAPTYTLDGKELQLKAFAGSKAIGVNANSKNPEVAVALAAFLGSTQAQQDHYDLRNIIPTDESLTVDDALATAQMNAMSYASIVQPLQADMGQYWTPAETMGKEIIAGTVTHDNAAEKTEAMNTSMNTATVN
ncbi:MAG: extracellular solute-binding protein [Erysipelotrichaceae bacterium]|nr:extracellular solute-binding protein [Erysipelotrichaceae bacterium]